MHLCFLGAFPKINVLFYVLELKCTYASVAKTNFPGENAPGPLIGEVRKLENGRETRLHCSKSIIGACFEEYVYLDFIQYKLQAKK